MGISFKGHDADVEYPTLLGIRVDGEDVDVDLTERSINREVERFQKGFLKKDVSLNTLAQFWRDRGRK